MISRQDLLGPDSPDGLEVFQLTTEHDVPSSHVYMEAQIFTPDSRRLVLHRSAHPHGSAPDDPDHQYLICDLDADGSLEAVTTEVGATAPSVSPDGEILYYFVNQTRVGGGRLLLRRVRLDGSDRETLLVVDAPLPGSGFRPSRPYPLSTISADGRRLAISAFLGDGEREEAPWGLLVCDLEAARVELVLEGPSWCNMHPQYCRSLVEPGLRDILIQENHGNVCDAQGQLARLTGGLGADVHVCRDDGTLLRDMPWGRDGNEFCQGHQCWQGRSGRAITSTSTRNPASARLIRGEPAAHVGHLGSGTPDAWREDLTQDVPHPDFYHFATDAAGARLITDGGPHGEGGSLWLGDLDAPGESGLGDLVYLLNPRSSWAKEAHIHPFLSPDGRTAFFNSDESGQLQAYMVRGWAD